MAREKVKEFFKSKFALFALVYAAVYLVANYFKYLDFMLIPILIWAFVSLDVEQGFYFFLYTQPLYRSELFIRPGIVAEVIYVVVFLVKFIIGVKKGKYQVNKKLLFLISLFSSFSVFVSIFNDFALYSIQYLFYLPIFFMIYSTREEYDFETIVRTVVYSLMFSCVLSLFILPITTRTTCYRVVDGALRFRGFYGSPNTLYMTALLGLSCFMYLYFKGKVEFSEYIGVYFSMLIITFLTSSKAGVLILLFLTILSVCLYLREDFKKRIIQVVIAILISVLIGILINSMSITIGNRFSDVAEDDVLNSVSTGRMDIWFAYLKDIFEKPTDFLFGHGMFSRYTFVAEQGAERAQHNLYIFLLYKFGLVGCLFLLYIIMQFIKDCGKGKPAFVNFIPLIYFLVGAFADNSFMYPQFYIIVAMALFHTNSKKEREKIKKKLKRNENKWLNMWFKRVGNNPFLFTTKYV